jgi:hypothetical protein
MKDAWTEGEQIPIEDSSRLGIGEWLLIIIFPGPLIMLLVGLYYLARKPREKGKKLAFASLVVGILYGLFGIWFESQFGPL